MTTLLEGGDVGDMGRSDYDTAWVARVPDASGCRPEFPEVTDVVRRRQRPDGGWSDDGHVGARVLATLASMLALTDFDNAKDDGARATRAVAFVQHHWRAAVDHPYVPIGFELIVPTLVREAARRGLALGNLLPECETMGADKLARVRPHVYDARASVGFSLEFLGDELSADDARRVVDARGSVSASISATAGYARCSRDPAALQYLSRCIRARSPEAISYSPDAGLFGAIWTLYHLDLGGLLRADDAHAIALARGIADAAGSHGIGWSTQTAYGDGDDTVLGLWTATVLGQHVDWTALRQYETDDFYIAHHGETTPAVSVNAHVLSAAQRFPGHFGPGTVGKLKRFLAQHQRSDGSWVDKWHVSPLYPTSRSVCALLPCDRDAAARGVDHLVRTQRRDGSWGVLDDGSAEETAYAMHALHAAHRAGHGGLLDTLRRAFVYLRAVHRPGAGHGPRLWIAKDLYRPRTVVEAAVLAALAQGHDLGLAAEGPHA